MPYALRASQPAGIGLDSVDIVLYEVPAAQHASAAGKLFCWIHGTGLLPPLESHTAARRAFLSACAVLSNREAPRAHKHCVRGLDRTENILPESGSRALCRPAALACAANTPKPQFHRKMPPGVYGVGGFYMDTLYLLRAKGGRWHRRVPCDPRRAQRWPWARLSGQPHSIRFSCTHRHCHRPTPAAAVVGVFPDSNLLREINLHISQFHRLPHTKHAPRRTCVQQCTPFSLALRSINTAVPLCWRAPREVVDTCLLGNPSCASDSLDDNG